MSERYTRLFSLPENLGQEGAPVVISAGALLRDNNTGKVIAQLKLRNISEQTIKSVKVRLNAYDMAGEGLKGVEGFSYIDLTVERNDVFGSQTPIVMQDRTTRSFSVEILSVVFVDGEIYQPDNRAVVSPVMGETLKVVRQMDEERERNSIAEREKKRRIIFRLSFLPLMMDVLAIFLYAMYCWRISYLRFAIYSEWSAWFVSLLVPCMCILVYYLCEGKQKWIWIAFGLSVAFLIFQIFIVYWTSYVDSALRLDLYDSNLTKVIDRLICGLRVLRDPPFRIYLPWLDIWGIFYRMSQLLFVGKNLCASIVLFLQVKKKKSAYGKI